MIDFNILKGFTFPVYWIAPLRKPVVAVSDYSNDVHVTINKSPDSQ